jgi:hypothetical protein
MEPSGESSHPPKLLITRALRPGGVLCTSGGRFGYGARIEDGPGIFSPGLQRGLEQIVPWARHDFEAVMDARVVRRGYTEK